MPTIKTETIIILRQFKSRIKFLILKSSSIKIVNCRTVWSFRLDVESLNYNNYFLANPVNSWRILSFLSICTFGLDFSPMLLAIFGWRNAEFLFEIAGKMAVVRHSDFDPDLFYLMKGTFENFSCFFKAQISQVSYRRNANLGFE